MMDNKNAAPGSAEKTDHAGVRIPPPFVFLGFLIAGIVSQSRWIEGVFPISMEFYLGALIVLFGLILMLTGARKFKKADTNIEPWKPTSNIISHGPYAYSRNPLYIAMTIIYLGIALAAGSTIALLLLVPCLLFIRYYVIAREESYLERAFGDEYLAYKCKVRRWI